MAVIVAAAGGVEVEKGAEAEVVINAVAAVEVGTTTDEGAAEIDIEAANEGTEAAVAEDDTTQGVVIVAEMNAPDIVVLGVATHAAKVVVPDIRRRPLSDNQSPL